MESTCPVCGYNQLYEPPYDESGVPSDEICPSCGFHFGYDDDEVGAIAFELWRVKWIQDGMVWFSKGRKPPLDWDPEKQLKNL